VWITLSRAIAGPSGVAAGRGDVHPATPPSFCGRKRRRMRYGLMTRKRGRGEKTALLLNSGRLCGVAVAAWERVFRFNVHFHHKTSSKIFNSYQWHNL
jgi:hypothetical protein